MEKQTLGKLAADGFGLLEPPALAEQAEPAKIASGTPIAELLGKAR
jgi:hypothetical protein